MMGMQTAPKQLFYDFCLDGAHATGGSRTGSEGYIVSPFQGRHAPDAKVPFVLMEAHHAEEPTRALYEDIKEELRLPLVNTDYRALARWPTYFTSACHVLRPHVRTPDYELAVTAIHDLMVELSAKLPNPNGLTSTELRQATMDDGALDDICRTVELLQWLLPGLMLNVACFRAQLTR